MGKTLLTAQKTSDEDTLTTPVTTHDYLVTTLHDVTDNPCDDIDGLEQITVKLTYVERVMVGIAGGQVRKRTTR
jgi:hypothetical protein